MVLRQSPNDKNTYRVLNLSNKLTILLVHDDEAQKSAAAVDVSIGSFADPKHAQGLAHFLEHMLFMGTETFPDENEYSSYLNAHGGGSNAYTTDENTVYYFDVNNSYFKGALDRFAAFFVCPLFTESATAREINAVDNEHGKNLQSDLWRGMQVVKSLARNDHPYSQFSTGNLETLKNEPASKGINMRELLLDFHKTYYSANMMKVAMYSNESLDTMHKWAEELFSNITNHEAKRFTVDGDPYLPNFLGRVIYREPIQDKKEVQVMIPMPPLKKHYKNKPLSYISHLFGHESKGSVLYALKEADLAHSLSSYIARNYSDFSLFCLYIQLTDKGIEEYSSVIESVFAYMGMLLEHGPQEWIAQEVQQTHNIDFQFQEKRRPDSMVTEFANNLQDFDTDDVLCGNTLIDNINLDLIKDYLECIRPENSIVMLSYKGVLEAKGVEAKEEKWYGVQFYDESYSSEQMSMFQTAISCKSDRWQNQVALPEKNAFLPSDFSLRSIDGKRKELIDDDGFSRPVLLQREIQKMNVNTNESNDEDKSKVSGYRIATPLEAIAESAASTATWKDEDEKNLIKPEETESNGNDNSNDTLDLQLEEAVTVAMDDIIIEEQRGGDRYSHISNTFYLQDSKWKTPKTNVCIQIDTPIAYESAGNSALTKLFMNILEEKVNEISYYADCAGLYFNCGSNSQGIYMNFHGYSHKLSVLMDRVLSMVCTIRTPGSCDDALYQRLKSKMLQDYANQKFAQPYRQCVTGSTRCLNHPVHTSDEKHFFLEKFSLNDFESFASKLFLQIYVTVFIHGNASPTEAKEITRSVCDKLNASPLPNAASLLLKQRAIDLLPGRQYTYRQFAVHKNPQEINSSVENTYIIDSSNFGCIEELALKGKGGGDEININMMRTRINMSARLSILAHILSEPAFNQLRSREQLGYIVSVSKKIVSSLIALRVIVQSNSKSAHYLDGRIETFFKSYRDELSSMSDEEYKSHISAVTERMKEKPKNLDNETDIYLSEIQSQTFAFQRRKTLCDEVQKITLDDLLKMYDMYFLPSPTRRKLSSQYFGCNAACPPSAVSPFGVPTILVDDPEVLKSQLTMLPLQDHEKAIQEEIL